MWSGASVLNTLLAAGANVGARNKYGRTPLYNIIATANIDAFRALIEADASVTVRNIDGNTPLHNLRFTYNDDPDDVRAVVDALVAAGSDVNAQNAAGNTPLHEAAEFVDSSYSENPDTGEREEVYAVSSAAIIALLDAGADASIRNNEGQTAWDLAQENEHLRGTDAYWRLNDARFNTPGPDARRAPPSRVAAEATSSGADSAKGGIGGQPPDGGTASAPVAASTSNPGVTVGGGSCQIPGFPNPGDMTNLGLSWCPARVGFQVRVFALQAEGMRCAVAANPSEATPEVVSRVRSQISEVCTRLDALVEGLGGATDCRCPPGFGGSGYSEDPSLIERNKERRAQRAKQQEEARQAAQREKRRIEANNAKVLNSNCSCISIKDNGEYTCLDGFVGGACDIRR